MKGVGIMMSLEEKVQLAVTRVNRLHDELCRIASPASGLAGTLVVQGILKEHWLSDTVTVGIDLVVTPAVAAVVAQPHTVFVEAAQHLKRAERELERRIWIAKNDPDYETKEKAFDELFQFA